MKDWKDLIYNAHTMMKDYYDYQTLSYMPIKDLMKEIDYFTPKLKEIAKRQEAARLEAQLQGKRQAGRRPPPPRKRR